MKKNLRRNISDKKIERRFNDSMASYQVKLECRVEALYSDRRMNENNKGVKIYLHSQFLSKQFGTDEV